MTAMIPKKTKNMPPPPTTKSKQQLSRKSIIVIITTSIIVVYISFAVTLFFLTSKSIKSKTSTTAEVTKALPKDADDKIDSGVTRTTTAGRLLEQVAVKSELAKVEGGRQKGRIEKSNFFRSEDNSVSIVSMKNNWGRMGQSCVLPRHPTKSHEDNIDDDIDNDDDDDDKEYKYALSSKLETDNDDPSSCSSESAVYTSTNNDDIQDYDEIKNKQNDFALTLCQNKDKCFTSTSAVNAVMDDNVKHKIDSNSNNNKVIDKILHDNNNDFKQEEPYPGMIMQVFPPGYENYKNYELEHVGDDSAAVQISHTAQSSSRKVRLCTNYNEIYSEAIRNKENDDDINDENDDKGLVQYINEYILLEQLHPELGLVDIYNIDFAYTPPIIRPPLLNYQSYRKYEKMGDRAFAGGSHGEVWRARRRCSSSNSSRRNNNDDDDHNDDDSNTSSSSADPLLTPCDENQELIMKRLKIEHGYDILEAGLREVHFGELLVREVADSSNLFTIYVDHFFRETNPASSNKEGTRGAEGDKKGDGGGIKNVELWIVFENAGPSLRSYLYTPVDQGDFIVYEHSSFWRKLRKSAHDYRKAASVYQGESSSHSSNETVSEGGELMKEVLRQILTSAAKMHDHGIIHRDIKPSNIMCKMKEKIEESQSNVPGFADGKGNGTPDMDIKSAHCVLGDLSSGYDEFTSQTMYSNGPSAAEQTDEYAPPEVLFGPIWVPFDSKKPQSYDSWSIGVVALEMLLGTPNVFSVDQRTTTILSNKMKKKGASTEDIQHALYLAALSQFCIYVPTTDADKSWPLRAGDPLHGSSIVKPTCTMKDFHSALRARDPLGMGFDSSSDLLLELIWGLLAWDTKKRLTPKEALAHRYFQNNAGSEEAVSSWTSSLLSPISSFLSSGEHNALESQMLDPRMDFNSSVPDISEFVCPKCGKSFEDYNSCHRHANSRRHAKFCTYDPSSLPPCLNAHSMLPAHPTSGYCDIQGRRRVIEDFHTIHLHPHHQFYGVFDGHNGNLASKYAASSLYGRLVKRFANLDAGVRRGGRWKEEVEELMSATFEELHEGILRAASLSPGGVMKDSGTTATALFVTKEAVVVANVGDSRAILSQGASYDAASSTARVGRKGDVTAVQLTVDHIASDTNEQARIKELGGFVSSAGGIDRVNGTLAVSRSLGDANLAHLLSRQPHVVAMSREDVKVQCGRQLQKKGEEPAGERSLEDGSATNMPCFIVLASDGLWDVMSNQEAVDMVVQVVRKYDPDHGISWEDGGAFQEAAQRLTEEAYVRGSTDNIGVCVVAIV